MSEINHATPKRAEAEDFGRIGLSSRSKFEESGLDHSAINHQKAGP